MRIASARRLLSSSTLIASHICFQTEIAGAFLINHSTGRNQNFAFQQKMSSLTGENSGDSSMEGSWSQLLPFEKHSHNSALIVIPENDNELFSRTSFRERLDATVNALKELKKTSVWVEVPMSKASLIEEMTDSGFEFHNAKGSSAKLNKWLPESVESKVPEFATHHVGVGAIVVNSRDEILCVRELRRNYRPWKVPGGLAELGEHIPEAAEREVLEETGIPTKFSSILSFRHSHGLANGRSDLYFVCQLEPVETIDEKTGKLIIPEPRAQECEIEAAKWIPLSEYRDMVDGVGLDQGHPMMQHVMQTYDEGKRIKQTTVTSIVPGRKPNPIYHPAL